MFSSYGRKLVSDNLLDILVIFCSTGHLYSVHEIICGVSNLD
jgi:hypothetical protein